MTYGPLLNRATQVVFEGVPTYPNPDRCWEVSEGRGCVGRAGGRSTVANPPWVTRLLLNQLYLHTCVPPLEQPDRQPTKCPCCCARR